MKETVASLMGCTSIPKPLHELTLGGYLFDTKQMFTMEQMYWSPSAEERMHDSRVSSMFVIQP